MTSVPETLQDEIRAIVEKNPSIMLSQLAREHGLEEGQIMPLLSPDMAVAVPADHFMDLWKEISQWKRITFIVVNEGMVVEVKGTLPQGSSGHGMFNLHEADNPLGGHIFIGKLGSIWLLSKPHFGVESHSVHFFTRENKPMFAVYVGRDPETRQLLEEVKNHFLTLKAKYGDHS
ncbi:heme utilization cystosolic carrier protein HutX [Desulfurispirillum indicum]|uniref:Heme utilization cystosolic carrier protein HutX n=1 Tax=Desulfurispirillum indicum (strain ATCC BAA-1389 / DSM 22839 / S5) TaxID=653733 RepID=E6W2J0_DESIS|nr:heme utilization cystosolic carrier protein HutX [Desulfurispirillum indicum]ADU66740.1 protein of unknown function DUF1008 [Desulfurispirillum indicum S5]UCZ56062.1 heme utilization cystosolic carrier protein HutX [Desulfurispirillum indicum]